MSLLVLLGHHNKLLGCEDCLLWFAGNGDPVYHGCVSHTTYLADGNNKGGTRERRIESQNNSNRVKKFEEKKNLRTKAKIPKLGPTSAQV